MPREHEEITPFIIFISFESERGCFASLNASSNPFNKNYSLISKSSLRHFAFPHKMSDTMSFANKQVEKKLRN